MLENESTQLERRQILRRTLREGAAWETPIHQLLAKISKKGRFVKKRVGAKAAKAAERFVSPGHELNAEESTTYRALAARANYLALDRPDCAFATKALCRPFSQPTKDSVESLKRLVRYLVGAPRLVWCFDFQPVPEAMTVYVDTDFGGATLPEDPRLEEQR